MRAVADGAYPTAPFLEPMAALGVTVVRRRRKGSALWTVPRPRRRGPRGPDRKSGDRRIDPAKRAGHRRGWAPGTSAPYGEPAANRSKTFVATWRPAGGAIRVALVDQPKGWVASFGTHPEATAADVPATVADRFALGVMFREARRSSGRGGSRSGSWGPTSGRSASAWGRSR